MDENQQDPFKELADRYFQRLDDLNEARPVFKGIEEGFVYFAQNILDEYKTAYTLLKAKERIKVERELYKLYRESEKLIPKKKRKFLFFKKPNLAKKLIDEEVRQETNKFFKEEARKLGVLLVIKKPHGGEAASNVGAEESPHGGEAASSGQEKASPQEPPESAQSAKEMPKDELHEVYVEEILDLIAPPFEELKEEAPKESDQEEDPLGENYGIDTEYEILEDDEEEEDDDDVEGD